MGFWGFQAIVNDAAFVQLRIALFVIGGFDVFFCRRRRRRAADDDAAADDGDADDMTAT